MADSYQSAGLQSKLISMPQINKNTELFDTNRAMLIVDQNFQIIWKTLNDIRARLNAQLK